MNLHARALAILIAGITFAAAGMTNVAPYATPSTSFVSGHESLAAVNDGFDPAGINDHRHGAYGNWPQTGTQWVELSWDRPISTREIQVYWWDDGHGVRLPTTCRLLYAGTDGKLTPAPDAQGLGVAGGCFNGTTFTEIETRKLRLEFDGNDKFSTGILEWRVLDSGRSSKFPPRISTDVDRVVVLPAKTWLHATVHGAADSTRWQKATGPGNVRFDHPEALETEASLDQPGRYQLALIATHGDQSVTGTVQVTARPADRMESRDRVVMRPYSITSPFWSPRLRNQIIHWIPHCIAQLSKPGLAEGGIANFAEAANRNAGRSFQPHQGAPWANAYTLNTIEAMCLALQYEAGADPEIRTAQEAIRAKLDAWIPIVLGAQEADGYLQTRFTLGVAREQGKAPARWSLVGDHEGYVAGYFMDAAVAHFRLTDGKDRRLYDSAKRLADCWDRNVGPATGKRWYDGHQAIEMALMRLAQLVDETEGAGQGDRYAALARHLLDNRGGDQSYHQAHRPVIHQYEAVGHAVRATYTYSAMTDVAMRTGDPAYRSAVESLCDNIVNSKYYVTGGIGSGETSEGFGANYSLPNSAYSESCADCGLLFFQHRMNLYDGQARHADLVEDALYNAVLGSMDLAGMNFTYTNPLEQQHARYGWHSCPCCIGNIPRTLLMLPVWMYSHRADELSVNLYVGSRVAVGAIAGTPVTVEQRTDYPWTGRVDVVLHPVATRTFTLRLRAPDREASALYKTKPEANGIDRILLNGQAVEAALEDGYAVLRRTWRPGDTVTLDLPLQPQLVTCDARVAANRGRVALRYGPLIYSVESIDQKLEGSIDSGAPLEARWQPELLGGIVTLSGKFKDGRTLLAIPNYARNNRGGRSVVWINAN